MTMAMAMEKDGKEGGGRGKGRGREKQMDIAKGGREMKRKNRMSNHVNNKGRSGGWEEEEKE